MKTPPTHNRPSHLALAAAKSAPGAPRSALQGKGAAAAKSKAKARAKAVACTPPVVYPPGWFTEPARAWAQLEWVPLIDWPGVRGQQSEQAQRGRDAARLSGAGWGNGTMALPGTPKGPAPRSQRSRSSA